MNELQRKEYIQNLQSLQSQLINNIESEINAAQNEKNDYCEPEKLKEKLLLIINNNSHLLTKKWY